MSLFGRNDSHHLSSFYKLIYFETLIIFPESTIKLITEIFYFQCFFQKRPARLEIKFQPNMKKILFIYFSLWVKWNEIVFRGWSKKTAHYKWPRIHVQMFVFLYNFISNSVYMKFYHPKKDFISVKMAQMGFIFGPYYVNSCEKLTGQGNENVSFYPKLNLM